MLSGCQYPPIEVQFIAFQIISVKPIQPSNALSSIDIPNSVKHIGFAAFENCVGLTSVTIPNSVTHIGVIAFCDCYNLTSVTIPNSVTYIGSDAFRTCTRLTDVTIGNSVASIGVGSFMECPSLMCVTCLEMTPPEVINDDWWSEPALFDEQCYQNATLYVPISAVQAYRNSPEWGRFQHIVGLYDYDFEQDGAFFKKVSDNEVALTIGENAYSGSVTVPTEVTYQGVTYAVTAIGDGAFADASLTSLSLPVTITSVGAGAFEGCVIQSLYITGSGEWTAGAIGAEVTNLYVGSETYDKAAGTFQAMDSCAENPLTFFPFEVLFGQREFFHQEALCPGVQQQDNFLIDSARHPENVRLGNLMLCLELPGRIGLLD